jgi:hypothetical protein
LHFSSSSMSVLHDALRRPTILAANFRQVKKKSYVKAINRRSRPSSDGKRREGEQR